MENKVLIEIICPILEKSYEIFVPVGKKIGTVIQLIIKSINELSEDNFPQDKEASLYCQATGEKYCKSITVKEAKIVNGTKIIII